MMNRFKSCLPLVAGITPTLTACLPSDGRNWLSGGVAVPARWHYRWGTTTAADNAALTTWWKQFHDPALNEVVTISLHSSTDVRIAQLRRPSEA